MGKPHIDHDHELGPWAVRGLLCQPCNNSLDYPSMSRRRTAYMTGCWYVGVLNASGVALAVPPEPPIGSVWIDIADRRRVRRPDGWYAHEGNRWHSRAAPWSWDCWISDVGPHNVNEWGQVTPSRKVTA